MSEINPEIGKPLTHWRLPFVVWTSETIDKGFGLSWRNQTPDELLNAAATTAAYGSIRTSNLLFNAALLKEDAIKHGINLEDKLP